MKIEGSEYVLMALAIGASVEEVKLYLACQLPHKFSRYCILKLGDIKTFLTFHIVFLYSTLHGIRHNS